MTKDKYEKIVGQLVNLKGILDKEYERAGEIHDNTMNDKIYASSHIETTVIASVADSIDEALKVMNNNNKRIAK